MSEPQVVMWVYDSAGQTITAQVQADGRSVVIATIPADQPEPTQ